MRHYFTYRPAVAILNLLCKVHIIVINLPPTYFYKNNVKKALLQQSYTIKNEKYESVNEGPSLWYVAVNCPSPFLIYFSLFFDIFWFLSNSNNNDNLTSRCLFSLSFFFLNYL